MKQAIRTWSFGCRMLEYHVMERSLSGEICDVDHCHIWSNNDVMVRSYGAVVSLGVCWFSTFSSLLLNKGWPALNSFSCRRCHLQQTSTVWFFQISALDLLSVGVRTCTFSEINAGRTPDVSHCCGASQAWWTPQWCPSWATWWTCVMCLSMEACMPLLMWLSAWALHWVSQRMSWSNAIKNQKVRLHYFRKNNAITQYCCLMCLTTVSLSQKVTRRCRVPVCSVLAAAVTEPDGSAACSPSRGLWFDPSPWYGSGFCTDLLRPLVFRPRLLTRSIKKKPIMQQETQAEIQQSERRNMSQAAHKETAAWQIKQAKCKQANWNST